MTQNAELQGNPLLCIEDLRRGGEDERGVRTVPKHLGHSINICRLKNRPEDPVSNFVFTGTQGTGKTAVASKMAKLLNAFGVLASDHVVATTALDLTATAECSAGSPRRSSRARCRRRAAAC
jgi:hypothetical protein